MINERLIFSCIRAATSLCLTLVIFLIANNVSRADTIAISIPRTGDFSEIGRQFEVGATLAMEKIGDGHELFIADDGCNPDQAMLAAQDIRSLEPAIVTGMICNVSALSIARELQADQIPILVAGARSVRLIKDRDRETWNIWRMSPGDDAPANTIASYISKNLKDTAFALIDDGTIYGRNITDAIRLQLNETGMEPQFADTFRAAQSTQSGMLRRLQRSGVEVAFIAAATREDLFTIAKDHKSLGIENKLVVTEQLASLPYLEGANLVTDGVSVVMQIPSLSLDSATNLTQLLKERNIEPSQSIYDGYAAIQVAIASMGTSYQATTNNLGSKAFNTVLGEVKFNSSGKNIYNPYALHIWQNQNLEPLDTSNNL